MGLIISTILMTPAIYLATDIFLPKTWCQYNTGGATATELAKDACFKSDPALKTVTSFSAFLAVSAGLWGGLAIGLITEYYTSFSYTPTQEVSESCETGAATNIIYGLALGYVSVIIPSIILALIAYFAQTQLGMFGIGLSALGMLSSL